MSGLAVGTLTCWAVVPGPTSSFYCWFSGVKIISLFWKCQYLPCTALVNTRVQFRVDCVYLSVVVFTRQDFISGLVYILWLLRILWECPTVLWVCLQIISLVLSGFVFYIVLLSAYCLELFIFLVMLDFFFSPLRMSAWELGMYFRARAWAEHVEGLSFTSWGLFPTRKQLHMLMSSDAFCWRALVWF